MTVSQLRRLCLLSLASLFVVSAGCSISSADAVTARLDVQSSPSALGGAAVTAVTGTYGPGCDGRSEAGTDPWTISVPGAPALDELSVRRNDSTCVHEPRFEGGLSLRRGDLTTTNVFLVKLVPPENIG